MKAPLFELPYINKEDIYKLENDIGRVIVITFWTSWCPDCGADLPKKEKLFETVDKEKLKMLTINVSGRERGRDAGITYAEKFLNQPTLRDEGKTIYDLYQCQGVPTTVIINPNGHITKQFGDNASFLEIMDTIGNILPETQ